MKRIIPIKDGLYAIKLSDLGYITPDDESFYMEDNINDNLFTGEDIANVYTLVSYKGNGLFQEYYSGEKVILCVRFYETEQAPTEGLFAHFNEESLLTFNNEHQRRAKFEFFKRIPLGVDAGALINITPEIIASINSNNLGDSIRKYIWELKKEVILQEFEELPYGSNERSL